MTPRHTIRYRHQHIDAIIACTASARRSLARGDRAAADLAVRCAITEARLARMR